MIVKNSSLSVDTEKLRKKILDLAMRGKLVPQDSQDEPASVLLEKIKEEKAQLIKEKKIKKSKPLPEITEEEKLFEIPESWEWVRLGEVGDLNNFNSVIPEELVEGSYLLELKDIERDTGIILSREYVKKNEVKSNKYLYSKDDVLFAKLRPYLMKILLADNNGYCTTELLPIKINGNIFNKFILYLLKSNYSYNFINANMHGVNLPRISPKKLSELLIPLPPLAEQKRIVVKIEECMQAIKVIEDSSKDYEKLESQLDKKVLDLAMRGKLVPQDSQDEPASVLLEKIKEEKSQLIKEKKIKKSKPLPEITEEEKPFEIPESWEWVRLGEITSTITKGTTPKGGSSAYKRSGINYYRAENVTMGKLDSRNIKYITQEVNDTYLKRSILEEEDILITIAGTLGRVAVVKKENLPANVNQAISISRLIDKESFDSDYLVYAISSLVKYTVMKSKTTSIPNLTLQHIRERTIPLPPLAEQKRIVAKIEEIKQYLEI